MESAETLAAADGAADYGSLLGELALPPVHNQTGTDSSAEAMEFVSVETTPVERGGGEAADQLVAARFRNSAGAESLRAQLLRPLPGRQHSYCPLGDELSHDKESFEEPCLEQHDGPARSLALERLVAPDRDAIVVHDAGGWCGPGTGRGDRFSTSYWGPEGGRLVRYLEAIIFESWYQSPVPPVKTRRGEIGLSDSWPRTVTLTEIVECHPPEELGAGEADCESFERTREYHYVDNRYVARDESSPLAAAAAGNGSEETAQ